MQNISKHRPVLDLYGGSANLSAQLAPDSPHIYCVDLVIPENTATQWPENISFCQSDVFSWVAEKARHKQNNTPTADTCSAIIDPPRGGMPERLPEFIHSLQCLNVTELIAVGCKTDTWARDVAGFVQRGCFIEKVAVFDFFPQTAHVESAVLLRRI
jgi:23S rRNA (uracil1939-C5)-methyltransferase